MALPTRGLYAPVKLIRSMLGTYPCSTGKMPSRGADGWVSSTRSRPTLGVNGNSNPDVWVGRKIGKSAVRRDSGDLIRFLNLSPRVQNTVVDLVLAR